MLTLARDRLPFLFLVSFFSCRMVVRPIYTLIFLTNWLTRRGLDGRSSPVLVFQAQSFFFACSIVNIKCHGTCWCLEYCCFWSPKHSCDGTLECQLYCNSANESYLTLDLVTLGNCWWLCFSVCWVPSSLDITNKASWPCSSSTFTGQVDIFFNLLISMFALNPWPGFRSL